MSRFVALSTSVLALSVLGSAPSFAAAKPTAASTATSSATAFCSQIQTSQTAIKTIVKAGQAKNAAIGAEWAKIAATAPAAIKSDVAAVAAAFAKAGSQADVKASTATLASVAVQSKNVASFVAKNCASGGAGAGGQGNPGDDGPDGDGPGRRQMDPAKIAALQACMKKNGVSMPTPGQGGGQLNFQDPKFQAAAKTCGFALGGGGFGRGGRGMSDEVRKCVADKGITLPERGQGGGQRPQFDEKTLAAIQACRAAHPSSNG